MKFINTFLGICAFFFVAWAIISVVSIDYRTSERLELNDDRIQF